MWQRLKNWLWGLTLRRAAMTSSHALGMMVAFCLPNLTVVTEHAAPFVMLMSARNLVPRMCFPSFSSSVFRDPLLWCVHLPRDDRPIEDLTDALQSLQEGLEVFLRRGIPVALLGVLNCALVGGYMWMHSATHVLKHSYLHGFDCLVG